MEACHSKRVISKTVSGVISVTALHDSRPVTADNLSPYPRSLFCPSLLRVLVRNRLVQNKNLSPKGVGHRCPPNSDVR